MISQMYTIFFVISLMMLVYLVETHSGKIIAAYPLLFFCVSVCLMGYMQMSTVTEASTAVNSVQVVYLGACFSPFFLFLCVADLCKIHINRVFQGILFAFATFIFFMVSTIGELGLYYKSITIVQKNGLSVIKKEYGPLHNLYLIYIALILILCLCLLIYSLRQRCEVSYITCTVLLILLFFVTAVYMYERLAHLEVELLPIGYLIACFVVLVLLNRISLYDVVAVSADSIAESDTNGFVIIGAKGRYYGANEAARKWFEELHELPIDITIETENTDFLKWIGLWLKGEQQQQITYFERDGKIIEARHTIIIKRMGEKVHCFFLRDDTKQQQYTKLVEQYNEDLERDVDSKTEKIREIQNDITISMASIVENRDNNTGGHIQRTSDIVKIFVKYLRSTNRYDFLDGTMANNIIKAAPLHDFGKIAIPDVILNKPGKFTDEEYEIMKQHSEKGALIVERILKNSEDTAFKKVAVNVAHYHHERWDGRGYPTGIGTTEIPFEARVMALADVFDALVSKRVYKDRFSYDQAFKIIEESGGSHFDPELCKDFLMCRSKLEELYNSFDD